jgi:hypothetical protein
MLSRTLLAHGYVDMQWIRIRMTFIVGTDEISKELIDDRGKFLTDKREIRWAFL